MSFIEHYLKECNLGELPTSTISNLTKIEQELAKKINQNPTTSTFDDVVTKYGSQIADITGRFAKCWSAVDGWSIQTVTGVLRFVLNIGIEVKQLVDQMKADIVTPDMSPEASYQAIIDFGQSIVYFIWKTVDPLKNHLNWVPFKSTIERKLVSWIAEMAFEFATDLFEKHFGVLENKTVAIKTL
jgi:hypothetical protein